MIEVAVNHHFFESLALQHDAIFFLAFFLLLRFAFVSIRVLALVKFDLMQRASETHLDEARFDDVRCLLLTFKLNDVFAIVRIK